MGNIRGFFRSDFSAFGAGAPNALKSDLKANLTHFGAKPTIPVSRPQQIIVCWSLADFSPINNNYIHVDLLCSVKTGLSSLGKISLNYEKFCVLKANFIYGSIRQFLDGRETIVTVYRSKSNEAECRLVYPVVNLSA